MKNIKLQNKTKIDISIINFQSWKSLTDFMRYPEREQENEKDISPVGLPEMATNVAKSVAADATALIAEDRSPLLECTGNCAKPL
jgi:hypothetical protein